MIYYFNKGEKKYFIYFFISSSIIIFILFYINTVNFQIHGQQYQLLPTPKQTQILNYSDPLGNYTLQYPKNWKVQYQKSYYKFGYPTTLFILPDHISIVSISMTNIQLNENKFQEGFLTFYPLILQERFENGIEIDNKTLDTYRIDGHIAGSITFTNYADNSHGLVKGLFITSVVGNNKIISITYISSQQFYDNNLKDIEQLVKTIKVTQDLISKNHN